MITTNRHQRILASSLLLFAPLFASLAPAQTPEWIWHPNDGQSPTNGEVRFFRKSFTVRGEVTKAVIAVAADNQATVWLNGQQAGRSDSHERAAYSDVTTRIKSGENVLAVRAVNNDGPAGVLVSLEITSAVQRKQPVVTDGSWLASATEEEDWRSATVKTPANWIAAKSLGKAGTQPWGDVLKPAQATSAEDIKVLPGFKIE